MKRLNPDYIENAVDIWDAMERADHQRQFSLLMKLNRAELTVLARHYKIEGLEYYVGPGDWKGGGKEELCHEIAEHMT